ncbi:MAG: hypothetical protein GVX96_05965 [Bacteroidetes bacterium]|jgi:cell division protein FtsQ|nr:hypothetical protein [Bacteroidota bacterium]
MKNWKLPEKYAMVLMAVAIIALGVLLRKAQTFNENLSVKGLNVHIEPLPLGGNMLNEASIREHFLTTLGYSPSEIPIRRLSMEKWESDLQKLDFVRRADIYVDGKRDLNIRVQQRKPILRCIKNGNSYYVDRKGSFLPNNGSYTPRLPVLRGHWPSNNKDEKWNSELVDIIQFFDQNEYERRLIDQLYRSADGTYTLTPVLGHLKIHFGDWASVDDKFSRLQQFFDEVLPEKGWTKYESIDVSYEDQVIAKMKV